MRIQKIIMGMILSASILLGGLAIESEAVNQTNQAATQNKTNTGVNQNATIKNNTQTRTNQNTSTQNTTNATNTTNSVKEKSNNANLSNLGIKPHDFSGFKYGKTSYEVAVPEDTENVEIYATAQHEKATVTGTGKKVLEKGENKAEVIVTAEDGTKKTYTIHIIREINQEDYSDTDPVITEEGKGKGLAQLKINHLTLSPEFKTNMYEYSVKYIGEDVKLDIETKPTSEDFIVEVIGNENLQEGENIITILVTEKNGENVATYQITLNKSLVDEEAIAREQNEKDKKQQKTVIGMIIAVVILMVIVLFMIMKSRKNRKIAEDFSGVSLYGKNGNLEEKEELPKALEKHEEEYQEEKKESTKKAKHKGKRFKEE